MGALGGEVGAEGRPESAELGAEAGWPVGGGEMGARIRAHDWAATPLGPPEAWSPSLRTAVGLMLASGFATTIAWGREALLLYNDAFGATLGPRHPGALGQSSYATFPATAASFAPLLARVWRGETVTLEDQPYPVERGAAVGAAVEGGRFTLTYTPLRDEAGAVAGVYTTLIETTRRVRAEAALRASEALFRSFAESSADTLWIVDAATRRLEYLSPAFERMWGEGREAVLRDLGRWADLVHPEDRGRAADFMPRALAGETVVVDYRIVRPSDGATRWIRDTGFPIHDERGRVARVAGIAQDVTDQKAAEAALREARDTLERRVATRTAELAVAVEGLRASEGRLRLLLAQMPAALWTTDTDLRVTALTGAAVPALPATLRGAAGRAVADLFAAGDADGQPVAAHRRALAGASVGFEVEAESRTYAAHVEPLRDADGRIVGAIGVAHDVTDRALLRLQDEFLALASHELRTPLTPARGYLELAPQALAAGDTARTLRYIARATEQVGRLDALVGDLLDVGRLRGGKVALERGEVHLVGVARRAVEAARVEAGAQGQAIALDVDAPAAGAPLLVRGDAGRLEQVALNLLTNAVKYAPRSPTIAVRLRRDADAGAAILEVADAGPGIPAADLPHLFSRFYQVERPDRPSRGGLGLGLYLVKELVEAHGGTVAVASAVGRGTTFTVRLPLAPDTGAGAATSDRGRAVL